MPSVPSLTLQWSALGPRRRSCTYQKPISERYASFPGMGKEGRSDIIFIHVKIPFLFLNLVVQSLSHVQLCNPMDCSTPGFPVITNSWSLLKLMPIVSVMASNHLILRHPLLPPSIFPSIRVFSNESALRIRWPKYWSFSFNISPSNEYSELISLITLQWPKLPNICWTTTLCLCHLYGYTIE